MSQWYPGLTLDAIEKDAILKAYSYCNQNATKTAKMLGISPRTLYEKLKKYGSDGQKADQPTPKTP